MKKVIDTQGYWGRPDYWGYGQPTEGYKSLQGRLGGLGYSVRFLIMPYTTEENSALPQAVYENPDLFLGGFLQINPNKGYTEMFAYSRSEEIEGLLSSDRNETIVGLKLHTSLTKTRVDSPLMDKFAMIAVDHDLPILFHCAASGHDFTRSDYFAALLHKYPDLKIICAHLGGLNENYIYGNPQENIPGYIELARDFPKNVYLNTSGVNGEKRRWELVNGKAGEVLRIPRLIQDPNRWKSPTQDVLNKIPDNVVLGCDFPELMWWTLHPISQAPEDIQRNVLYENSLKLFGFKDRF